MRIICPNCSTEYFLESAKLDLDGTPVQCSSCEHVFTVFPAGSGPKDAPSRSSRSVVPPPPPVGEDPRAGLFLAQGDRIYKVKDLATLQRWIVEKRVLPGDRVSSDGKSWEVVSSRSDLRSFFAVIEQIKVAKRAMQRYRREKEEVEARLAEVEHPEAEPRRLDAVADGPPIRFAPFPAVPDSAPPPGDPAPPRPAPRAEEEDEASIRATERTTQPGRRMPEPEAAAQAEAPGTEEATGPEPGEPRADEEVDKAEDTDKSGAMEAARAASADAEADGASDAEGAGAREPDEDEDEDEDEAPHEEGDEGDGDDAALPPEPISARFAALREEEVETPPAPTRDGDPGPVVPPVTGAADELDDGIRGSARQAPPAGVSVSWPPQDAVRPGPGEDAGEEQDDSAVDDSGDFFSDDAPKVPPPAEAPSLDRVPAITMAPRGGPHTPRIERSGSFSGGSWSRPTPEPDLPSISDSGEVSDPFTPPLEALRAASLTRPQPEAERAGPPPLLAAQAAREAGGLDDADASDGAETSDDFDPDQTFEEYDRSSSLGPVAIGALALVAVLALSAWWLISGGTTEEGPAPDPDPTAVAVREPESPSAPQATGGAGAETGSGDEEPEGEGIAEVDPAGGPEAEEEVAPTPASTPEPVATPKPVATPEPVATPAPTPKPTPAATPGPSATPKPAATPDPAAGAAALAKQGDRARERGDFAGAIRAYQQALEADPNDIDTRVQLGWSFIEQGQNEAAAKAFRAVQARAPRRADAYYGLGLAQQALGRADEARAQYERYLEIQPSGRDSNEVRAMLRSLQ